MVPGSPARTKIRDVTQWSLSYQKTWRRLSRRHFRRFELILTANIPSHFCHETILPPTCDYSTEITGFKSIEIAKSRTQNTRAIPLVREVYALTLAMIVAVKTSLRIYM